jgi:NhaP-type Na+/H+ and K+/H+ antiporter
MHRLGRVAAANIGLTVLSRGEFSLILASLALAAGLDARLGSFTAGYVLVLAIIGPIAVASSDRLARLFPARLFPVRPNPRPAPRPGSRAGSRGGPELEMDVGTASLERLGSDLLHVRVTDGSRLHGVYVAELRLPSASTLGMVVRSGTATAPAPDTRLLRGDVLVVFTPPEHRLATERRLRAVHRSGRLARWRGDHGF